MIGGLKDEQDSDDHDQEYWAAQFGAADENKKGPARAVSDEVTRR